MWFTYKNIGKLLPAREYRTYLFLFLWAFWNACLKLVVLRRMSSPAYQTVKIQNFSFIAMAFSYLV